MLFEQLLGIVSPNLVFPRFRGLMAGTSPWGRCLHCNEGHHPFHLVSDQGKFQHHVPHVGVYGINKDHPCILHQNNRRKYIICKMILKKNEKAQFFQKKGKCGDILWTRALDAKHIINFIWPYLVYRKVYKRIYH